MNSFDNRIKNKIDGHTMPVAGDMWSKISQSKDMPREEDSRRSIWLMSGLFLLLVSSFGYMMTSYSTVDKNTVEAAAPKAVFANTETTVVEPMSKKVLESTQTAIENTNKETVVTTIALKESQVTNTAPVVASNSVKSIESKSVVLPSKVAPVTVQKIESSIVKINEPTLQSVPVMLESVDEDIFVSANTVINNFSSRANENLTIKSNIGLNVNSKINFLENNILSNTLFNVEEKVDLGQKVYHKKPDCYSFGRSEVGTQFSLDAYGGPLYAMNSFAAAPNSQDVDGAYLASRKDSEVEVLGFTAGLRLSVLFNEKFAIRSGVNYSQNVERFEFAMDNVEVTTRTINTYTIDNGNGPMTFMDTTFVTTTGSQVVEHYNRVKYLDIPVMIGFEKEIYNNWSFNINAGAMINVKSSASGRILDIDQRIMDFDNNSVNNANVYKTSVGLSLMASVGLNYKLNDNLKILFEPQFRKILSPISESTHTLEQSQSHVSFVTGLRYTF